MASGSALLLAAHVAGNGGFFAAVFLLARGLSPAERGTMAFLTVTALVASRVGKLGVSDATTFLAAERPRRRAAILANLIGVTILGAAATAAAVLGALVVLADLRPAGIGKVELGLIFAGTIATALMEAGYGFLLGCGRMHANALVAATAPWLYAALLGAAALQAGLTVTRAAAVWAVAHGTWAAALLVASARGIGLGRPSLALLRESLSLGLRIWLGSLARILNFRVDQILMGFIASETALGIYAVAVNGSEVLLYLPTVAASVLLPALARSPRAARPEQTLRMFRMLALLTGIAVALAAALGPLLIPAIFGADYRGSVLPFLWLLPGAFGFAASAVFSNALIAASAPGRSSIGPLVSLVVGLALDIALIPSYGASGAAVAASIAFLAGGAAALIIYRQATLFPWRQIMPGLADLAEARVLATGMVSRARRDTKA